MPKVRKPKTSKTVSGSGAMVVDGMAEVVELNKKRKPKRAKKEKVDLHVKYPWVVKGSVREVAKGEEIDRGDTLPTLVSKGKVCKVACTDCSVKLEINVQDAFQVKMCPKCKRNAAKARRAELRVARKTG